MTININNSVKHLSHIRLLRIIDIPVYTRLTPK